MLVPSFCGIVIFTPCSRVPLLSLVVENNYVRVPAVVTALECYTAGPVLESLAISYKNSSKCLPALFRCLPRVKHLRKLDISLTKWGKTPGLNAMLLQALKRNSSLWQVTADLQEDWSEGDIAVTNFYVKRNKKIHAILEAPTDQAQALLANLAPIFRAIWGCEMEASIILVALKALMSRWVRRIQKQQSQDTKRRWDTS
jgi:hypothetical protein